MSAEGAEVADLKKRIAERRADWFVDPTPPSKAAPRFVAKRAADALHAETPVAIGGARFWIFDGSGYVDGEDDLQRRIADTLGDKWVKRYADETLAYLRAVAPRLWDEPPLDRVAVRNGILDLLDPALPILGEPDPAFLSTVRLSAAFDPEAECPETDAFLEATIDAETRSLIYEMVGYAIVPDNGLQVAFMLVGPGGTGKSTLISQIESLLGRENVAHVSLHRLEADRFAPADLYGRLLNTVADLDAREVRHSSIFKAITGGDVIRGERKHRDPFDFTPFSRLIFSTNDPPAVADAGDAFFRRWKVVPCERRLPPEARDPKMIEKLTTQAELSGLLNRALAGLASLRSRGRFAETTATKRAGSNFRYRADTVAAFFEECCVPDPEGAEARPDLYGAYRLWCGTSGRNPIPSARLYDRLREEPFGLIDKTVRGVRKLAGAQLLASAERAEARDGQE
jgi:putative DNA primase/helicase